MRFLGLGPTAPYLIPWSSLSPFFPKLLPKLFSVPSSFFLPSTLSTSHYASIPSFQNQPTKVAKLASKMSEIDLIHPMAPRRTKLGNPGPLGLFSFASTTLILSLYNVHARGILVPNVVVGMAIFCGGLAQFLAGMWEFAAGNTFGATAFSSYGAFWLSFAALLIPGSGIGDAYATSDDPGKIVDAIAIYLTAWTVVTFLFFLASLRKSVGLTALFFCLTTTFLLLAVADFAASENIGKIGGGVGIITALIAYYCGLAELLTEDDLFTIPIGKYPSKQV